MQPTSAEQQEKEVCPKCNSQLTFSHKDGEISYYTCPKCGQINLKKEKWKKLLKDPIPTSEKMKIQITCDFCKKRNDENCYDAGLDATICGKYEEDMQISNAEKLIMLIKAQEPILFMDQYKTGCAYVEDYGIWKTFVINSKPFKFYSSKLFFKALGRVLTTENMKNGIRTIEAFARDGEKLVLSNRISSIQTEQGLEIWFDMCDKDCRSIQVTKERHVIVKKTPPIFRKYSHQLPLCEPKTYGNDDTNCSSTRLSTPPSPLISDKKKGVGVKSPVPTSVVSSVSPKSLDQIFKFINVQEKDRLLFKCILIGNCIPLYPHVVTAIIGPKGSCKSSFSKIVRTLIDPTTIEKLNLPRNTKELLQIIDHHYLCFFDNINYITKEQSDIFCRVATGIGLQKRELYSDDEDIVRQLLRCIGLNGINIATTQEDLLDRTVLIKFLPISEDNRKTEEELYREFEEVRPYLFGEILDVLSKTLKILSNIKTKKLFRMADFCKISCAVAVALGYKQEDFLDAYEEKIKDQIKEAVYNSTLGNILLDFMYSRPEWTGSASTLFKLLVAHAKELGVSTRVREFPKAPNILSRKMNLLVESFKALDIEINFLADGYRTIEILNHNNKESKVEGPKDTPKLGEILKHNNKEPKVDEPKNKKDRTFQVHCGDCGKVLQKHEVYTYGVTPLCRECRLKIEDQKPKKYCEHLDSENQICKHPDGSEIGVNVNICTLEASKDCAILHPEKEAS